jgi:hypothetical protein
MMTVCEKINKLLLKHTGMEFTCYLPVINKNISDAGKAAWRRFGKTIGQSRTDGKIICQRELRP